MPQFKTISDRKPTLAEAQEFVGGMVELIELGDSQLLVNEEGKLEKLEVNHEATKFWMASGKWRGDYIVGNALLLKGKARWS